MTNWGDIAINQIAAKDENRLREAKYRANADQHLAAETKHPLAGIIHAIREHLSSPRDTDEAEASLPLEPRRKPAG